MINAPPFDQPVFTSGDVVALAGITYRQLDSWQRVGLHHSARLAGGSGVPRGYSRDDLLFFAAQGALARLGVGPVVAVRFRDRLIAAIGALRGSPAGTVAPLFRFESGNGEGGAAELPGLSITIDLARMEDALALRIEQSGRAARGGAVSAPRRRKRAVEPVSGRSRVTSKLQGGRPADFED